MTNAIGVDWAKHGWVGVSENQAEGLSVKFYSTIYEIWDDLSEGGCIAIDIPIGLGTDGVRKCDQEAKQCLGAQGRSVFYTPTRNAVYSSNICEAKEEQSELDFSIQSQAWALTPRIREVDRFHQSCNEKLDKRQIVETHPEVAFASLNGGNALETSKKSRTGESERLALLDDHLDDVKPRFNEASLEYGGPQYATKLVCRDDILDAMVALLVAIEGRNHLPSFPNQADPHFDETLGRYCEITYPCEVDWPI